MANVLMARYIHSKCSRNIFELLKVNILKEPKRVAFQTLASTVSHRYVKNEKSLKIDKLHKCNLSVSNYLRSTESEHNHATHWTAERALSLMMLGTIPAAILFPSIEYLLALTVTVHSHWGIEAIVVDYVRPSVFGPVIPKVALGTVYALSFLTLGGLCYFIYTDVGLINAMKLLWKL